MRRTLYVALLAAATSLWACDAAPITGELDPEGGAGGGRGAGAVPESVPPSGYSACTTDTWQSYAEAGLTSGCARCHAEMSTYAGVTARSAAVRDSIASGAMPSDGTTLPPGDVAKLTRWIDCDLAP